MAIFPFGIKMFTKKVDRKDKVMAEDINTVYDEVTAVETEVLKQSDSMSVLSATLAENTQEKLFEKYPFSVDVDEAYCVNADGHLNITNYLGGTNEHCHPSVVYFRKPFKGYHYWMVDTAFDGALSANENPCIYGSNDGLTWSVPAGVTNPIVPKPTDAPSSYNADPYLILDRDGKTLYMAYKVYDTKGLRIVIRNSTDLVNWSEEKTIVPSADLTGGDGQCPIIKWDGTKYNLWTVTIATTPYQLIKRTCDTVDGTYTNKTVCTFVLPTGRSPWHFDICQFGDEYHMALQDCTNGQSGSGGELYFAKSKDGLAWTISKTSLIKGDYGIWDKYVYKPAIIPFFKNGKLAYKMWYGSGYNLWYIGYTEITFDKSQRLQNIRNGMNSGLNNVGTFKVVDTFNRADNVAMGNAGSGQAWATGASTTSLQILGKKAASTGAVNSMNIVDTGLANKYKISVKVNEDSANWIVFRYTDGTHFFRFGKTTAGNAITVQKVNGTLTIPAQNLGISKAGDIYTVEVVDDVITCRVNGVLKYTFTDTFNNTATKHGIQTDKASTSFSEFYVEDIS